MSDWSLATATAGSSGSTRRPAPEPRAPGPAVNHPMGIAAVVKPAPRAALAARQWWPPATGHSRRFGLEPTPKGCVWPTSGTRRQRRVRAGHRRGVTATRTPPPGDLHVRVARERPPGAGRWPRRCPRGRQHSPHHQASAALRGVGVGRAPRRAKRRAAQASCPPVYEDSLQALRGGRVKVTVRGLGRGAQPRARVLNRNGKRETTPFSQRRGLKPGRYRCCGSSGRVGTRPRTAKLSCLRW